MKAIETKPGVTLGFYLMVNYLQRSKSLCYAKPWMKGEA